MAPARKKSKLTKDDQLEAPTVPVGPVAPDNQSLPNTTTVQQLKSDGGATDYSADTPGQQRKVPSVRSGWTESWRSKASPVAQVVRHSISVDKGVSSESPEHSNARPGAAQSVSNSFRGGSRKSSALVGDTTKVHATSNVSQPPKAQRQPNETAEEKDKSVDVEESKQERTVVPEEASLQPADVDMVDGDPKAETASLNARPTSWFGWWSRPDEYASEVTKNKSATKAQLDAISMPQNEDNNDACQTTFSGSDALQTLPDVNENVAAMAQPEMSASPGPGRSWFRLWSSTQNEQAAEEDRQRRLSEQNQEVLHDLPQSQDIAKQDTVIMEGNIEQEADRPKSSGWAFWSKDRSQNTQLQREDAKKDVGELAVADTPSQSHPEAAQFNQERDVTGADATSAKRSGSLLQVKRGRAVQTKDQMGDSSISTPTTSSNVQTPAISQLQTPIDTPEGSPAPPRKGKKPQTRPNLVLPSVRDTYPNSPAPGVVERLTHYIAQSLHIPGYTTAKQLRHPHITSAPPKVRKAIAIGVHGYFPAALLQRVIGQPTGTSIRFANYAATSIKQWCQDHQPEIKDVEVEKVALEGEGFIADRVTTLWKLLLNWLSHLRQADFILVACHSQGVPVAIMLVTKLIQLGCLNSHVRLGVCAMAGINLGPFPEYKSRFFGGSALELFEFSDSRSKVSIAYAESLELCLRHGVRVTFVGSIDDQLVSLESSLHMPLSHPYVSRIVFIDGRLHTSNFLTHLVVFALKLRNLGISDHGLIRELSGPLAGSLVGGEGHSRVYDDPIVYKNAIEFALETTDMSAMAFVVPTSPEDRRKSAEAATSRRASLAGYPSNMSAANSMRRGSLSSLSLFAPGIAPVVAPYEPLGATAEKNPFVLPWAVRGMLAEDVVRHDPKLQLEVKELVEAFEHWRPTSKVLKDVRWRLEGVRSML